METWDIGFLLGRVFMVGVIAFIIYSVYKDIKNKRDKNRRGE
jgi:hypothetical protein